MQIFKNKSYLLTGLLGLGLGILLLAGCSSPAVKAVSADVQATARQQITQSPTRTPTLTTTPKPTHTPTPAPTPTPPNKIQTVFLILMENHNWEQIQGNPSAPYINQTLLPQASYTEQYYNPPNTHPSEPNYLWLEAGTAFGISGDGEPGRDHQATKDHLVAYLDKVGLSWKVYTEGISGTDCPLVSHDHYAARHVPMIFFDDVTGKNDAQSAYCIAHVRPLFELEQDLKTGKVANYNFIVPDTCHDMHDATGCATPDPVKNGDTWLSQNAGMILNSSAYKSSGALFITWDESVVGDHPIGMIVISPFAKGGGYSNSIQYDHSSTLRTLEEIFNLQPWLGAAGQAKDLSDLFRVFP